MWTYFQRLRPSGELITPVSTVVILALIVCFSTDAVAFDRKTDDSSRSANESEKVKSDIKNFGKVGDHFFRGAQPRPEDYPVLARLGIKTVIDLRHDPKGYASESANRAGLQYISFPLSDHDYPAADSAEKFLSIVTNGANWPIFVHCAGGRHRTGIMAAVYRMTVEGWDISEAYREMKDYDFYTRWGHQVMKDFIFDYSDRLKEKRSSQLAATPAATSPGATEVSDPDHQPR